MSSHDLPHIDSTPPFFFNRHHYFQHNPIQILNRRRDITTELRGYHGLVPIKTLRFPYVNTSPFFWTHEFIHAAAPKFVLGFAPSSESKRTWTCHNAVLCENFRVRCRKDQSVNQSVSLHFARTHTAEMRVDILHRPKYAWICGKNVPPRITSTT